MFMMFSSLACAALSAVAAMSCVVAGTDAAGTALACGAVNAGLFVLVVAAVIFCM